MYPMINLVINMIGDEGCEYLIRSHWPNLKILNIID